jgi:hypothetical protein
MEDHNLEQMLRELPRERAREGFTPRVLARLDARPEAAGWRRPRLVFAAAALVAVIAAAGVFQVFQYQAGRAEEIRRAEARRLLHELRSEHDDLRQEFESLSAPPVVYVGGNEQVDLVVDLSRVQSANF